MNIYYLILFNIILLILLLNKKKTFCGGNTELSIQEKQILANIKKEENNKNMLELAKSERSMLKKRLDVLEASYRAQNELEEIKKKKNKIKKKNFKPKQQKLNTLYKYSEILNSPYRETIEKVNNLKLWCKDYFDKLINSSDKNLINDVINVCNILK